MIIMMMMMTMMIIHHSMLTYLFCSNTNVDRGHDHYVLPLSALYQHPSTGAVMDSSDAAAVKCQEEPENIAFQNLWQVD